MSVCLSLNIISSQQTQTCDGKLPFESFRIRFRHCLIILKECYTSKNQLHKFLSLWGKIEYHII